MDKPKQFTYFDFNSTKPNQIHLDGCKDQPKKSVIKIGPFNSLSTLVKYIDQIGLPVVVPHTCTDISIQVWRRKENKRMKGL